MKLIAIDPYISRNKPTMRFWVEAFPFFRDLFDSVEIWATETDVKAGGNVTVTGFPQRLPTWSLHALDFQRWATGKVKALPPSRDTVIFCSGCNVSRADIRYMQFWHHAYLDECRKRPAELNLKLYQWVLSKLSAHIEKQVLTDPAATGYWWSVSRSIGERIAADGGRGEFRILPNSFDDRRFHPGVRDEWREQMRRHYNIRAGEQVLAFSSFGHFERKGLTQAVQTVALLRSRGHDVRLLLLGGNAGTLAGFKKRMGQLGLKEDLCIFAGLVDPVERHLAAADAFFFPSHFEAFSLSEIEAAAMGLRLYLTPHHGSEMILREPANGRLLPWDPEGMAAILGEELTSGVLGLPHREMGEALTPAGFGNRIRELFAEVIEAKRNGVRHPVEPVQHGPLTAF